MGMRGYKDTENICRDEVDSKSYCERLVPSYQIMNTSAVLCMMRQPIESDPSCCCQRTVKLFTYKAAFCNFH